MFELTEFRQGKDNFLAHDHHSPLLESQRHGFSGLNYFDEDPAMSLTLELERYEKPDAIEMQTSTGEVATYLRWGKVSFQVRGKPAELTLYKNPDGDELFLPFADATSGQETYPSGRYLDIPALPDGRVKVDFNYAYNPYCAYNEAWSCPLTPFENRLRVPIEAGEKAFK